MPLSGRASLIFVLLFVAVAWVPLGCKRGGALQTITVYCAVDQPYASKVFEEFEKQTGIRVAPLYDIESSKSMGLAGKLEAECDRAGPNNIKAMKVDYSEASRTFARAMRQGTAILEGHD
jgi:iron(III) transport system substrate-binding protein